MVSGDHAQSTANVNLRYSASLSAGIATVVPSGTVVKITGGISNGFYAVDWDGLGGFMSADYLVKTDAALSQRGGSAEPTTPTSPAPAPGGTATGNALVNYAMNYVGYPYVWATHGPSSFDCSGFTYWVVKNVSGKNIGTGTWTQVSAGTPVSRANLQPGDLVFFQNTYTAGLSHVGLYIGGNQFIHAQNESTGVVISSLDSTYYASRWYGAVRVV
jgi:cell wall-associated NlpC family hydrolase